MPKADNNEGLLAIADALHRTFTGGDAGPSQATFDHLLTLGLRHGLDDTTLKIGALAEANQNVADAVDRAGSDIAAAINNLAEAIRQAQTA